MPRKLLRVALVAAILPALAPENSSAQAVKPASTVSTTAPNQPGKTGVAGWVQRMRGPKPAPSTGKIIKVSAENPFEDSAARASTPFDLEGNSDVRLLKSNQSTRRRPNFQIEEPEPVVRSRQAVVESARTGTAENSSGTQDPAAGLSQQATGADFDNPFPDDVPTKPRNRQVAAPLNQMEGNIPSPLTNDVATPVNGEVEPGAYPIESAAPPVDLNGSYQGYDVQPQFRRTNMQVPPAPDVVLPPGGDVNFANPPTGRVATRMNGGPAVINVPHSALPLYGQAPMPPQIYGGGPAGFARLDGALYPSPRQDIPGYVGSTMITNQAFAPHEMLYAHHYRGLYGPFYHKTCRSWIMTPFGICKNEKRVLVGTEVRVNYKSSISPFSLFFPPVVR